MLPKKSRIPRKLFVELLSGARFVHSPNFTLRFRAVDQDQNKAGVSVSKKVSKSAVVRNTLRRRVYSSLKPFINDSKSFLFLLVAKPSAKELKGEKLSKELEDLFGEFERVVSEGKKSYNS